MNDTASKPKLKLGFTDTFDNCKLFFTDVLSRRYEVIRDDADPKYLIFGDENFGRENYKYDFKYVKKIFYTGENVRPIYLSYDHAITFDFENSPRHYRLPLYVMEMWALINDDKFTPDFDYLVDLHTRVDWESEWNQKTTAITYLQSNPNCVPRNEFVQGLLNTNAFPVLCGGPHLNNIGHVIPRNRLDKMKFLAANKMNVAFENGSHPGYVTEKLLDAFYSNTLPIYWGSRNIERDFNRQSFLIVPEPLTLAKNPTSTVAFLKRVMESKKEWCEIMSKPRFNGNMANSYTQLDNFLDWFGENVYEGE